MPDSFAVVGAASLAASDLLARSELISDESALRIDSFFGDWTRLDQLPTPYSNDRGARREVIQEIQADEGLLDVNTDEASAILEESLVDRTGTPIMVLGQPTGLAVTTDPEEALASLLRHFERKVRSKVVFVMQAKFGEHWIEEKCGEFLPDWKTKREAEAQAGLEPGHLIEYSSLHDLQKIITRHWAEGFGVPGKKPRIISQPINAIIPFRNRTSHARSVTSEILFGAVHNVRKIESWLSDDMPEDEES